MLIEMDWQVARLASTLNEPSPWLGLLNEFPSPAAARHSLATQWNQKHCQEWSRFPAAAFAIPRKEAA